MAKLLFVLIVIGVIVFIGWVMVRNYRMRRGMMGARDLSRSSFGG
jgi:lipopolysaccharide biosynthesis regulator YciM